MNGMQLYRLGRRLTKIGESAFMGPSIADLPPGVALILLDVFAHPGTSISEVVERTGLPQSHVSKSVARFRERGAVTTAPDPADGRRTIVTPTTWAQDVAARRTSGPIDTALAEALGETDTARVRAIVDLLESMAQKLAAGHAASAHPQPLAAGSRGRKGS